MMGFKIGRLCKSLVRSGWTFRSGGAWIAGSLSTLCLLRPILLSVVLIIASVTAPLADSLEDAALAYKQKDYAKAVELWRPIAIQGNQFAQLKLGQMYELGLGVPPDHNLAVHWLRLSAEQENADAQVQLGAMYEFGEGEVQDSTEAAKWYLRAANHNHSRAQLTIGMFYMSGTGVPKNLVLAFKWLTLAIESAPTLHADQAPNSKFILQWANAYLKDITSEMSSAEIQEAGDLVSSWRSE